MLLQIFLEDYEFLCDTRIKIFLVEQIRARQHLKGVTTRELLCSNCTFGTAYFLTTRKIHQFFSPSPSSVLNTKAAMEM